MAEWKIKLKEHIKNNYPSLENQADDLIKRIEENDKLYFKGSSTGGTNSSKGNRSVSSGLSSKSKASNKKNVRKP